MGDSFENLDDLSLEELINLKKVVSCDMVHIIDAKIYSKTFSGNYLDKYDRKNRADGKLRVKKRINKSYKNDNKKNRR